MHPATARCTIAAPATPFLSVKDKIAAFLDGSTHGEDLLHALYDHILEEPIPEAMRALLNGK